MKKKFIFFLSALFLFTNSGFTKQEENQKEHSLGEESKENDNGKNEITESMLCNLGSLDDENYLPNRDYSAAKKLFGEGKCYKLSNTDQEKNDDPRQLIEFYSCNESLHNIDPSTVTDWDKKECKININMTRCGVFLVAVCVGSYFIVKKMLPYFSDMLSDMDFQE